MALQSGAAGKWEVRANGHVDNGGFFNEDASGTDLTQQDSAEQVYTDLVIDATNNDEITSAAERSFIAADVGNCIHITSGTGWTTGRYEITAVSAGKATVDRAIGTTGSTGSNGRLGGAITIDQGDAFFENATDGPRSGNTLYIKNDGTHTITSSVVVARDGSVSNPIKFEGYNTTRGDGWTAGANRPLLACGAYAWQFDNYWEMYHMRGTSTEANGWDVDQNSRIINCEVHNTSGSANREGIFLGVEGYAGYCEVISDSGPAIEVRNRAVASHIYARDSVTGIIIRSSWVVNAIVDNCTVGVDAPADNILMNGLIAYDCGTGVNLTGRSAAIIMNATISDCTTGIVNTASGNPNPLNKFFDINFHNNTTDKTDINADQIFGETAVDPGFTDPANGDFTPSADFHGTGSEFPGGDNTGIVSPSVIQVAQASGGAGVPQGLHPINSGITA